MTAARLEPIPPTQGSVVPLSESLRCVIGSATDATVRIDGPEVRVQHCVIEGRAQRWLVVEADPAVTLNGRPLAGVTRLFDRDILTFSPTQHWEFVSGEQRTAEMPVFRDTGSHTRRKSDGFELPRRRVPWRSLSFLAIAALCVGVAAITAWYALRAPEDQGTLLTDRQAIQFDSLLSVAYDHLERGSSLLELGFPDEAAREFARGINTLALNELRNHPQVAPRIQALESSVAAIYRERRITVPDAYVGARSSIAPDRIRTAVLSRDQFAHGFDLVSGAFRLRFRQSIVVVGRDHAEHLTLYGEGGALDLRSLTMTAEQVAFVIAQCRSFGIRVKDFSQDSILQQQVRAAVRAGLPDRAGTGLHLHIDRFADRRDRWTIGARTPEVAPHRRYQTSRNLSRVTPDSVNSEPSSSNFGSPRSSGASSTDVPLRLESMR
jgi:hypothetical protein